ncbi:MAG: hypothetical protein HKUEN01_34520 [Candidatus Kuenenia stuttgartiensis]|jgi:hypothetical protein|nr:MAG: hypothetical protein HKUEN01_34520 [Candidatus Kuenenia stuttgartiensis]
MRKDLGETWGRILNIKPGWIEAQLEEKARITGNLKPGILVFSVFLRLGE